MWKPPERIKHYPSPGQWPTATQVASSRLFSPINIGTMTLSQRTWIPAMVPWRADQQGFVTQEVLDWYGRFARGKPGAIVVEATGIRDVPSGPLLRIGHDRYLPGLQQLVERVRQESEGQTRLLIQVIDFLSIRRRPQPGKYFQQYLTITPEHRQALGAEDWSEQAVRDHLLTLDEEQLTTVLNARELEGLHAGYRERVTDTHLPHIAELPQVLPELFASAAKRAKTAGFDGVELHYAHAYTMASFLSKTNTREDGYGGSVHDRLRLPLEVYQQVRKRVGDDYIVGCRFLSEECVDGGNTLEDSQIIARALAEAGMDFLSLSRGGKFDDAKRPKVGEASYPYTGVSGYECMPQYISDEKGPFGRNVEPVASIKQEVNQLGLPTPIVVAGGIHNFTQAESLLAQDKADIVGFARQALADPDWFEKVRSGCGDQVRLCEYSNYCEGLDQKHKQVTCQLWDRMDLDEPGIVKCNKGKRRLTAPNWKRTQ
jgi:2,4-dienoyl-CoA reductase-like NADH-dependent reductase (Old Yellow Enzyme family)